MARSEAAIDKRAVTRNEQRDMGAPRGERAVHAPGPRRRMRRGADVAEEMRAPGAGVKARRHLPIDPAEVMLFGREQQRLGKLFIPRAHEVARYPRMRELTDGDDAGVFGAEKHRRLPFGRKPCHAALRHFRGLATRGTIFQANRIQTLKFNFNPGRGQRVL